VEDAIKYVFDFERHMTPEKFERLKTFAADKETPFVVIDLERIAEKYDELHRLLPYAKVYYAVKANPHDEILKMLIARGCRFDIASVFELDQMLRLGAKPDDMSYGNTIKKARHIAYAYDRGIRLFATDSEEDVCKIAENAPGASVFFRILTDGSGADWPLSRKFGAHPDTIYRLVLQAAELGLDPYGISFHVGSQQRDIGQWDHAIATCRYLFDSLAEEGVHLRMLNLGGGFPANYVSPTQDIELYCQEITRFLEDDFGDHAPEILIEPGRSLVGDSGVLVSEVVLVSKKSEFNQYSWVYLDVGKFSGLIETIDESIKYPIFVDRESDAVKQVILAGPTCDSMDILYEDTKYEMPAEITEGDRVYIFTTGAYTTSYSSVNFNGFPPLKAYIYHG
jgi:ornithine decarboxylase